MPPRSSNDVDAVFAALADPTRRRVVDLLRERPRRASDLAVGSGMNPAGMSRHLRVLRTAGLVEVETPAHDTRERVYRLRPDQFVALQAWLDQVQAFWSEQLGRFKDHTERERR